jgi:hypothetical protein
MRCCVALYKAISANERRSLQNYPRDTEIL